MKNKMDKCILFFMNKQRTHTIKSFLKKIVHEDIFPPLTRTSNYTGQGIHCSEI